MILIEKLVFSDVNYQHVRDQPDNIANAKLKKANQLESIILIANIHVKAIHDWGIHLIMSDQESVSSITSPPSNIQNQLGLILSQSTIFYLTRPKDY